MKYWLYQIETVDTEQVYIGITSRSNPFRRYSEHLTRLRGGHHPSRRFQEVWDSNPSICNLRFQCLERCETKSEAEYKEASAVSDLYPQYRLNEQRPVAGGRLLYRVERLDREGYSGNRIAEELGISPGYVSKLKSRIKESSVFQ